MQHLKHYTIDDIKKIRWELGEISQTRLASMIGVTKSIICMVEKGKRCASKKLTKKLEDLELQYNINVRARRNENV